MDSSTRSRGFRVAIIGGGIGGLFCTLAIHHHCSNAGVNVQIDVYEQASEYREIGAGVGIGVNAAKLAHKLGIGHQLNSIGGDRSKVWFSLRRYDNSEEIMLLPAVGDSTVRGVPCSRYDLLNLLRGTIQDRQAAALHTKKKCLRVEERGDGVIAHFEDGSSASADLVIGCDGIHSAVRNQFVDDKPINSGRIAYRSVVPISSLKNWPADTYSIIWMAKHKHFLVYPISRNEQLNIVAFISKGQHEISDVKESWTSVCDRKEVEEDFKEFDEPVQQMIALMEEKPGKWRLNDRAPLERWHFQGGKVILLGDSAHAMLPHMGAGAGQSIEDGWVLGRALSEHLSGSAHDAFTTLESTAQFYQDLRLPRAQRTQAGSRLSGNTYEMQTEAMRGKTYEECLTILPATTEQRMKDVWEEDIEASYEKMKNGQY
ncbi:hypothetical protein BJ170DRAFT_644552 [Xylariales sp. AK1849]|nr:hypothetical protein BJ170DRAFT_644552 [Xylariales sp. AK1849]